jgi:hypothetical protein
VVISGPGPFICIGWCNRWMCLRRTVGFWPVMSIESMPSMMDKVINLIFRCWHRHMTCPITPVGKPGTSPITYVTCLDCGRQFRFDPVQMRIGKAISNISTSRTAN